MSLITERTFGIGAGATEEWVSITIDGDHAPDSARITEDGASVVPLRRVRDEEQRDFLWKGRYFHEVDIKNMNILDGLDLRCLCWFIDLKKKVRLEESYIAPALMEDLAEAFKARVKMGVKVMEGSSITFSSVGGYSGLSYDSYEVAEAAKALGFRVFER